jgi:competence ComEA-like helix-hairpin-helix protein
MGLIVAGLALAAFAAQRAVPPETAPVAVFAAQPSGAKPELRALRDGQRLDVNRASAEDLTLIPGVGPKLAQRIVAERARQGQFTSLSQLRAVRGLGPKIWLRVEPFVELGHGSNR